MQIRDWMSLIASMAALSGCHGAGDVVAMPSNITLRTALVATIDALEAAHEESLKTRKTADGPIGLNPCTVNVTFNVAASGTDTTQGGGNVGTPAAGAPIAASLNLTVTNSLTASRGNQIVVGFATPACNPSGTLGTTAPSDVVLLEREIEAARTGVADPIKWPSGYRPISIPGGGGAAGGGAAGGGAAAGKASETGDKSSLNSPTTMGGAYHMQVR